MSPDQLAAVEQAFTNWNGVGNVSFSLMTSTQDIYATNVYTVKYGPLPPDPTMGIPNGTTLPGFNQDTGIVEDASTTINNLATTCLVCITKTMAHEIAHTFGMADNFIAGSVIQDQCAASPNSFPDNCQAIGPSQTDMQTADCESAYASNICINPGDSTAAACQCGAGTSGNCSGGLECQDSTCSCTSSCDDVNCPGYNSYVCCNVCDPSCGDYNPNNSSCESQCLGYDKPGCPTAECEGGMWTCADSPILIDVKGEGFHLTSAGNGVQFDFIGNGNKVKIAWTDPKFGNAWLALDRNGNGMIDNASELFGNITPQPPSDNPNGYVALSVYDKPENGGNGDGFISDKDAIYDKLRLWIDANHNGISEPEELHTLKEFKIDRISIDYKELDKVDQFGNLFRFRARVWDKDGLRPDRWTYDVFLQQQ